jgi:hypothetical protein
VKTPSAAVGLCCLLLLAHPTLAEDRDIPALPLCRPIHEFRTPVPIWRPGPPLTRDGKLSSAPPRGRDGVIYIGLGVDSEFPACSPSSDEDFIFEVPSGSPGLQSGGQRIKMLGGAVRYDFLRDCIFRGFYANEPVAGVRDGWSETNLRALDTFEVLSSGRYCLADAASSVDAPNRSRPRHPAPTHSTPRTTSRAVLPTCRRFGETRMEVPVWQPKLTSEGNLLSEPPQREDGLVYISIVSNENCPGPWQDRFHTLVRPDDPDKSYSESGGLELLLRGHIRSENGQCVWSGLFLNDDNGSKHGWTSVVYIAVEERKLAASNQYCLARRHGPLRRGPKEE